ncbi:hypothetical protein ACFYNX_20970 [Streptomyces sp. NPDC007872]|uniref:hypothetical protein n=1 Tax=Streptomyces sp. NPDC007872 TaxID=3364782 RepID=UPI0036BFF571
MLDPGELLDLAESIKAEGLRKDIVLDVEGVLLDGRSRLAICEVAGVEPCFTTYTGDDPRALTFSSDAVLTTLPSEPRRPVLSRVRRRTR